MSRRKQAKPRPIFVYEEEVTDVQTEEAFEPIETQPAQNGQVNGEVNQEDQDEFGEFAPLIMDTSSQDGRQSTSSPPPTPSSIKPISDLPSQDGLMFNPQSIKPGPPKDMPFLFAQTQLEVKKISPSIPRFNSASSFAAALSSSNSNDSLSLGPMGFQNPPNCDEASSMSDSTSVPTSPSVLRRGSKQSEMVTDDNGENLDFDPDFDDLEELLKELIRNKILPISDENGEKFVCPVCNISLLNLHDLTVHIRSHNTPAPGNQSNTCKICAKILSSQSSLDRHMLVHSGERPFLCKVCNMSFTTNGNMHRHARIHSKEEHSNAAANTPAKLQMRRGKAAWRQRLGQYLTQNNSPVSDRMKTQELLQTLPNHSQQSLFGRPTENLPAMMPNLKRQFSNGPDPSPDWSIPFKRQSLENNNDIFKYNYTMNTVKGEQPGQIKQERMDDRDDTVDKDLLHCPVCSKTFLCKNGLENHMESHPDFVSHCSICNLMFENPRKLRVHRLIAHSDVSKEETTKSDVDEKSDNKVEVGFHDLSFVDFSIDKFPLIAKHYFEENIRVPSSVYLNFTCKKCSKAFPCETSLYLHSFSHTKDKATQCPICESDYTSNSELHTHMLKHLADRAFEEIRPSSKNEKGDDDVMPDRLPKHDFLAMFELKEDEGSSDMKVGSSPPPKKEESKPIKSAERKINNDYFAKLGQVFGAGLPPLFNQLPFFPPGYQPTLDDFHKMLQIATNMNSLPSMGPGLLMKGLAGSSDSSPSKSQTVSQSKSHHDEPPQTSPVPAHSNNAKRGLMLASPKLDERQSMSGPETEIKNIKMQNSKMWLCRYCDNTFNSFKTLEAHIRTHLGHSPYQCNLCVYVSQDKSSLIRHIRSHTGNRPFQCLECDFAFTTRANCERHIRKKHYIELKEDIERSVYINRNALEYDHNKFNSPATMCKYCSVDFKYFRALKNHLRSHVTSQQKPYQCVLCKMGFCAKFVSVRHIHKSHPEVSDVHIDGFIKIVYDVDNKREEEASQDDGIPLYSIDTPEFSPFDHRSENGTPQPPAAHSTPKLDSYIGRSSSHVSPSSQGVSASSRLVSPSSRHVSPHAHVSPASSPLVIKTEPVDRCEESPLDFSRKGVSDPVDMSKGKSTADDAAMDLSCKKSSPEQQTSPLSTSAGGESGIFQCIYCPMLYTNVAAFDRHMRHQHGHVTSSESTMSLSAHFASFPLMNNEGKVLLPPKSAVLPFHAAKELILSNRQRPIQPKGKTALNTLQSLQDKIKMNLTRDSMTLSPSGMDTDLTSVRKMIDATDSLNFQAFLNQEQPNDKTPQMKSNFPKILRRPGVQISLEHCNAINRELDNLQREGDVDEIALAQVREMALSVKEECVNNTPLAPPMTVVSTPAAPPAPVNIAPSPMTSDLHQEDENSGDGSLSGKKSEGDLNGENAPVKKKRNSYADSPHKLSCPYCPRAFPWVSSLTRHLLTHTGQKPFKCPRCPVTFSTKSNRERHLIRKHGVNMLDPMSRQTMDRPYKCPLCVFSSFSTQSNLLKHYRDRHNGINLPDNIDDIERMSPSAIKAATLEMESRALENPPQVLEDGTAVNPATEEDEEDLDNSLDSCEKMDEESSYTEMEMPEDLPPRPDSGSGMSESSLTSMPIHPVPMMVGNPVEPLVEKMKIAPHLLMMKMPELKRMTEERPVEVKQEMEVDEERRDGERRPESPNTMAANIERIIAEQKRIIEQKAQMEMKIQAEIRAQIEAQKKVDMNRSVSPVPHDTLMETPKVLKQFTGSAERIINPERDNYDVDKITECWKCKSIFPSRKVLVRHLKEHNIDLPFKCYLCDASFDARVDCLYHQDMFHSSDWKILKEKNKVVDIEQFALHMDKVVENNCNKLDSGSVLEIPGTGMDESKMEVISADYMQRKVYCSLCPKRFWSLQDLRRHLRSHTGERPFECDICQKRFTLKHSMMRHRKKHIGAPPRHFDDDEDSNGMDLKVNKIAKPMPSRPTNMFPFPVGLPFPTSLNEVQQLTNTFLFSQGLSGSTLRIGPSNVGALAGTSAGALAGTSARALAGTSAGALAGASAVASAAMAHLPKPLLAAVQTPKPVVSTATKTSTETSPVSPASNSTSTSVSPTPTAVDTVKKEFLDCSADMLHNLLGVESDEIEKMIDNADSKSAAKFLGLTEVS